MIHSFMPLIVGTINWLSDIAGKMHMTSGAIMNSIAEKVRQSVNDITGNTKLEHWTIMTNNFANTYHVDSNDVVTKYFDFIWAYLMNCGNQIIIEYFLRFQILFPELFRQKKWPVSTTCCWVPMSKNSDWIHVEYFVFLDLLLALDLSSDMFTNRAKQLGCTFLGGAFGHLTTRSLYVHRNGRNVSTIPPPLCNGNAAWGEYTSKSAS